MILDKFSNIQIYDSIVNNLDNALEAVSALTSYEEGRYEFDGGYFMIQKEIIKPLSEGKFETHRKYVDLQLIVEGSEELAWNDINDLQEKAPYNESKDKQNYTGTAKYLTPVDEGMFYIMFPHDGHMATVHIKEPQSFTKVVIKLPVD